MILQKLKSSQSLCIIEENKSGFVGGNTYREATLLSPNHFVAYWVCCLMGNSYRCLGYSRYVFGDDACKTGHYIYGYINRFIWVTPAMLLIIKYNNKLKFSKSELFSRPKFSKSLISVMIISLIYSVISMLIIHKGFWFNKEINLLLVIVKFIIVGCVEEIVFRGWGYNALVNVISGKKAVIISTLCFIILHWSAYFIGVYRFGTFNFERILLQSLAALVWGIIFCWLLKKDKTLWSPIIAHSFYDLMITSLVQQ